MSSKLSNMKFMRGSAAMENHQSKQESKKQQQPTQDTERTTTTSMVDYDEATTDSSSSTAPTQQRFIQLNNSSSKDSARLYNESFSKDMNDNSNEVPNSTPGLTKDTRLDEHRKVGAARRTFGGFKSNQNK